ncbi:MAG: DNA primase [Acidobacteria bacterium]|nr:MAG: DNA primase [Acidobacteriota bacterium]PYQ88043.1 MAG: DNA primase [Acidobacteriota bacterium]PYR04910.1 MAG: DNA primase [Acidobacteriota bacterium]
MGLFPQQFIDDLRLQANIVQVVQEYVPLKRVGNTYKGLCPFHSEKTPSFHVNPEKGFFHCFGCGVGGDVFKFLEMHEKLAFPDAVRTLAQKFGLSLPERSEGNDDDARRDSALREALLKAHEVAASYFREQLASPAGARARQQLAERDVAPATVEALGLGFAPPAREGLKARLLDHGFAQGLLLESGLIVQRDNGDVVDRFRNRLMVPICRDMGSVIAFGGRAMDADQAPKYLNSPETPIYSKSRTLYGLNLTKGQIRKVGFAVLVEGYFDFAQLFQSQAVPVVASCGTALTPQQAQLLRRYSSKVVLSFDPDAAGQGAAARSCEMLVSEGFDVNVVVLDKGEDPDTFIRRHGAERYRERLRGSRPYLEYLLDQAATGLDLSHDDSRRQFLGRMLAVAARLPDAAARDQFADRIAHKARITEDVVRAEIRKAAVNRRTTLTTRELPSFGQLKQAEKALIWALIHDTADALGALGELDDADLETLAGREIFEMARSLQNNAADVLPSALLQRLSTVNAQLVTSIAASPTPPAPAVECARALKRLRWERERADIQREIDRLQQLGAQQHGSEINDLWQRKKDLMHRIEDLT